MYRVAALLTSAEVARHLGWQPVTVARKLRSGEIPGGIKMGRRWKLPVEVLMLFLAALYGRW